MHFTIHPTHLPDGTLVTYAVQKINFGNRSNTQSINAPAVNAATTPMPSSEANADITNTATLPIPSSQAIADMTNTATMPIPSSQAYADITNTDTTPSSEWVLSTKRAINEISKEIKQLKKRRRYLKKALKKEQ
ncbi:hypothetical protein BDF20DRAFT_470964 [Mycotypha africana]|uniref:uncharacterized protein n=1 Tax=Mycotypha africana TaxID=64632 RepID=UPI002301BAD5|nr:uncharacterized protein BDF20DRAFT_470964 [Mycotypha africana]KAI8982427.1 hypothetical protein BDF20DRAFT_470964 [Mycotypha africana]